MVFLPKISPKLSSKSLIPTNLLKLGVSPTLQSLNFLLLSLVRSQKLPLIPFLFSQFAHNSHSTIQSSHFSRQIRLLDGLIRRLCFASKCPDEALSLAQHCIKAGVCLPSRGTIRCLVLSFCACGEPGRAVEVLETMGGGVDDFVCSSVVSGFVKVGKPELGVGFYEKVKMIDGFRPSLVTCTAVVGVLCGVGRVGEASELVQKMEMDGLILDAVVYSSWVCGLFRSGDLMEGLRKHWLMVKKGIVPDVISYSVVVDGLSKHGSVEKVVGFLNEMKRNGIEPNLITYTAIVRGFCKRGKIKEGYCMLEKAEELGIVLDEFVYAILVDGLCKVGDLDRVFVVLEEMEKKGIEAGCVTYNTVINGLCKAGKVIEADEISKDFSGDNFTYSTLLHGYTKEMDVEGVMEIKKRMEEAGILMDAVTCNVLMKALFMLGMVEDAFKLFRGMPQMGLVPNFVTYSTMIDGFCKLHKIDEAMQLFHEYKQTSSNSSVACHDCLIRGLCKKGMIEMAVEVFHDLIEKKLIPDTSIYMTLIRAQYKEGGGAAVMKFIQSIESFEPTLLSLICNDAISFLCAEGCFEAALGIYFLIRGAVVITSKSYYRLFKTPIQGGIEYLSQLIINDFVKAHGISEPAMISAGALHLCKRNVDKAIQFLRVAGKKNISVSVLTDIISALKKEGRAKDAYKFLMEAEEDGSSVNVVVYSSVVDCLCEEGFLENALDLCQSMMRKGTRPDIVTYNSVMKGLCNQGCLLEAFRLFDSLEQNNVSPTIVTYAILISALSREGFLQDAKAVFEKMVTKNITPNTRIYNLLINGYCNFGSVQEALKLLLDMEKSCLQPDAFTVSSVINGCCLKGDIEGALDLFSDYRKRELFPDFLGFLNLIKGLFTKGREEEVRNIVRDMLQCPEIITMINRAGNDLNVESLVSLLGLACEQGKIEEVINVLNEVGSTTYSSWRTDCDFRLKQLKQLQDFGTDVSMAGSAGGSIGLRAMEAPRCMHDSSRSKCTTSEIIDQNDRLGKVKESDHVEDYEKLIRKSLPSDFDSCYSIICSLCSKGELQKANSVVRAMLLNSENC